MGHRIVLNRQPFKLRWLIEVKGLRMGVFWTQSEWEWVVGHSGQIGGAEWPNTPSLRPEGRPTNTKGLGGARGSLPIIARDQRTGGPIVEWKTRSEKPE